VTTRQLRPVLVHLPDIPVEDLRSSIAADPSAWLPAPARWRSTDAWLVTVDGGPLQRSVTCEVSSAWRKGEVLWRHLLWHPLAGPEDLLPSTLLPVFSGSIGVRPAVPGSLLVLQGSYTVPAGALGAAVDAALLHRVAERTANAFLDDVADRVVPGRSRRNGPAASTELPAAPPGR
jgi:hypothetical protein